MSDRYTIGQAARDQIRDIIADLRAEPNPPWPAGDWEAYRGRAVSHIRALLAQRHRLDYVR